MLHFARASVVMSHKSNPCSVFASQVCLHAASQLNAKDVVTEQALLSNDVTTGFW